MLQMRADRVVRVEAGRVGRQLKQPQSIPGEPLADPRPRKPKRANHLFGRFSGLDTLHGSFRPSHSTSLPHFTVGPKRDRNVRTLMHGLVPCFTNTLTCDSPRPGEAPQQDERPHPGARPGHGVDSQIRDRTYEPVYLVTVPVGRADYLPSRASRDPFRRLPERSWKHGRHSFHALPLIAL